MQNTEGYPFMRFVFVFATLLATQLFAADDTLSLGDFETWTWEGLEKSTEQVKQGTHSGKWANLKQSPTIKPKRVPEDWSSYDRLTFWMYSEKANGQSLTLVCNSENKADKEGWDYYFLHFRVDWEGWKLFNLRLGGDIVGTRKPVGWHKIDYLSINAGGWQHHPLADTVLYVDDVKLVRDPVRVRVTDREVVQEDGLRRIIYSLEIENRSGEALSFGLESRSRGEADEHVYTLGGVLRKTPEIAAGETATIRPELSASAKRLAAGEPLTREEFVITVKTGNPDIPDPEVILGAAIPLPEREHPLLFATADTFAQAKARAEKYPWAKKTLDGIISSADSAAALTVDIPDEVGQWSQRQACVQGLRRGVHRLAV